MPLRYLALGDSYTIGTSVDESERWPVQLAALLRAEGFELAPPEIIATDGWTTAELDAGVEAARPRGPFDLVSLLIGVNNQYRGLPLDEYRQEFHALLETAIQLTRGEAGHVLVLSIPDWGMTPFAKERGRKPEEVAAAIDRFNEVNRAETAAAGARYVDVTPISRRASEETWLIAADGLHPSGAMYRTWAEHTLPQALAALRT